jgi:anti-sigma-K factor RskA
MPAVPEDKIYQVWVIEDDVPKPSGLFEPGQESVAAVVEHPVESDDAVEVTVELQGGFTQAD